MQLGRSYINRLTMIKYFYQIALDFSYKPEPLSYLSLLIFHDSCEFFLDLSADYLEVNKTKLNFLEYWEEINKKLERKGKKNSLSQKRAMKRLNTARNSLKHQGISPTKGDLETYRVNVTNFFEENISNIFGIEFIDISLMNLINNQNAKKALKLAEKYLEQKKYYEAISNVAFGFSILIKDYEKTADKHLNLRRPSFKFVEKYIAAPHGSYSDKLDELNDLASDVSSFADDVENSLFAIEEVVRITSLGLDYRKYLKFRSLIPNIGKNEKMEYYSMFTRNLDGTKPPPASEKEIKFCINFVLEAALKIQDFTFNIP